MALNFPHKNKAGVSSSFLSDGALPLFRIHKEHRGGKAMGHRQEDRLIPCGNRLGTHPHWESCGYLISG